MLLLHNEILNNNWKDNSTNSKETKNAAVDDEVIVEEPEDDMEM